MAAWRAGWWIMDWICIEPNGAVLYFNRTNGLPSDWIRALCEDREGNLWVGTGNGLAVLREGKVATVNPPDQWQGRGLLSVTSTRNGALWIGTEGAGLVPPEPRKVETLRHGDGVSNLFVWSRFRRCAGSDLGGHVGWRNVRSTGRTFRTPPGLEDDTVPMLRCFRAGGGHVDRYRDRPDRTTKGAKWSVTGATKA